MFPFKIRYSKELDVSFDSNNIKEYIDLLIKILEAEGADYFSRESDCIKFENRFLKLVWNWNLMIATDAGFVEIKKSIRNRVKIRYGITLLRIWIPSILIPILIFFLENDITYSLIAFIIGIFICFVTAMRHLGLFFEMIREIKKIKK